MQAGLAWLLECLNPGDSAQLSCECKIIQTKGVNCSSRYLLEYREVLLLTSRASSQGWEVREIENTTTFRPFHHPTSIDRRNGQEREKHQLLPFCGAIPCQRDPWPEAAGEGVP